MILGISTRGAKRVKLLDLFIVMIKSHRNDAGVGIWAIYQRKEKRKKPMKSGLTGQTALLHRIFLPLLQLGWSREAARWPVRLVLLLLRLTAATVVLLANSQQATRSSRCAV